MVQLDRSQMMIRIIWCMCFACWITKATDTHSKYVILTAFPWQQRLHERAQWYVTCTLPVLFKVLPVLK